MVRTSQILDPIVFHQSGLLPIFNNCQVLRYESYVSVGTFVTRQNVSQLILYGKISADGEARKAPWFIRRRRL